MKGPQRVHPARRHPWFAGMAFNVHKDGVEAASTADEQIEAVEGGMDTGHVIASSTFLKLLSAGLEQSCAHLVLEWTYFTHTRLWWWRYAVDIE